MVHFWHRYWATIIDFDKIDRDLKASFATPFSSSVAELRSAREYPGYFEESSDLQAWARWPSYYVEMSSVWYDVLHWLDSA